MRFQSIVCKLLDSYLAAVLFLVFAHPIRFYDNLNAFIHMRETLKYFFFLLEFGVIVSCALLCAKRHFLEQQKIGRKKTDVDIDAQSAMA